MVGSLKNSGWETINTPLASSGVLRGFIFIMSGYDSCWEFILVSGFRGEDCF